MSTHLIITVDYETFGNGTGCLKHCVIQPAERMLEIASRFNAPVTFFVEALEFIAMEKQGLPEVELVRRQIAQAVLSGHDAQLHLHPQWEQVHLEEGVWRLDLNRWRIGGLSLEEDVSMLQKGRVWLEELLWDIPSYRCETFRAGGWCIQPSVRVMQALSELGFLIDSTVAPGQRNATSAGWYDFTKTPPKPYWRVKDDVCRESGGTIWEVPIAAGKISVFEHLQGIRATRARGVFAPDCKGSYYAGGDSSLRGQVEKILQMGKVMLDISTMPFSVLVAVTRQWLEHHKGWQNIPVVAIAHTKNFTSASAENMARYLQWAQDEGLVLSTYGNWMTSLNDRIE